MARRNIGRFDFGVVDRLRLGWRLLRDPRIPAWPKLLIPAAAIIYVLSPIDALPDMIPFLGQVDDAGVIALAIAAVTMLVRWSPRDIVAEHAANLGLGGLHEVQPDFNAAAKREKRSPQDPIEASYWVDDWR